MDAARFLGWTVEEVSYVVLPQFRRAGLATKALCRALDWAAEEVGLRVASLRCDVENHASRRVAGKSGFTLIGQTGDELRFRCDFRVGG